MDRRKEIEIIIQYLKQEIFDIQKEYPSLVLSKIVENGRLIEDYQIELSKLENENSQH